MMDKMLDLDPSLCTLRGHGNDARKLLDYLFSKQAEMIGHQTEGPLVPICERLHATVPKISSITIETLVRILRTEPSAYSQLFSELCDLEKLPNCNSADEFLVRFILKFPAS